MALYLHWIVLLPLLGFLINGTVGARLTRAASGLIGCAAAGAAFGLAFLATRPVFSGAAESIASNLGSWINCGGISVPYGFALDRLSSVMILVVTGVGFLIHVYSLGYMHEDKGIARYFAYLNLFLAAMTLLVLAGNLVLMFVGWEGVGLCSYLLIGFWFDDRKNAVAGQKAFVVNRVGDLGFLLGIFMAWSLFGTLDFAGMRDGLTAARAVHSFGPVAAWIALLLFVGATGKSAQIPLYVWLPDAMAGPTPVSALIHAATMVTAGVYMMARMHFIYALPEAAGVSAMIAGIGGLTAFVGGLIAFGQTDIKKVLAYSTVSQLGYMVMACGAGAFGLAVFHLVTHAFFKALLFLGVGAVIHALHGEQDLFRMGGLWKKIPLTFATLAIGAAALGGVPGFAGHVSKDAIVEAVYAKWHAGGNWVYGMAWGLSLAAAVGTAFYITRMMCLAFLGEFRGEHEKLHHAHEAPPSMALVLVILAVFSVISGHWDVPGFLNPGWKPVEEARGMSTTSAILLFGALGAIALALLLYTRLPGVVRAWAERNPVGRPLTAALRRSLGIDALYDVLVVLPLKIGAWVLWLVVDRFLIDGILVEGPARTVAALSRLRREFHPGLLNVSLAFFAGGMLVMMLYAARLYDLLRF